MATEDVAKLRPGTRVAVMFGPRPMVGILLDLVTHTDVPTDKIKAVNAILDAEPVIPADAMALYQWTAEYYHHALGDVLQNALPSWLRQADRRDIDTVTAWEASDVGCADTAREQLGRARKQIQLFDYLLNSDAPIAEEILLQQSFTRPLIQALQEKHLIRPVRVKLSTATPPTYGESLSLNDEQRDGLDSIMSQQGCTLLAGITGSGKTEVYLQAIEAVLRRGQQALVLIPEIGLTPQTLARFEKRFGPCIHVLNSACSDGERLNTWLAARDGRAPIVIGTRSAIFTPMANLGLIIVDEEHDASFKQQDGLRYSARDLAVVRGDMASARVVLGSATPSLESLANVANKRYRIAKLTRRAGEATPPSLETIDLRHQPLNNGFAEPSIRAIRQCLDAGKQALVFINRRGYAPVLMCHDCGWNAHCDHCDARMTIHMRPAHMHCHHCDARGALPKRCPACRSSQLVLIGQGTERSEEALQGLFPTVEVLRIDRDTTSRKTAMQALVERINDGQPRILVGTQMLAKGHHFPSLGLVLILDVDGGLFSADFRGPEKMAQLLIQVAGRAGREDAHGKVVIQTHHPDHPQLQLLLQKGYFHFASAQLKLREQMGLPPYRAMAIIRADANTMEAPEQFLQQVMDIAQHISAGKVQLLGPLPSPMPKRAGKYRAQLIMQAAHKGVLKAFLTHLVPAIEPLRGSAQLHWSLDIDPMDMF
ncbi:MAG: hypothetical protein RL336_1204 [Pseudomonadota bacterium]|jgi:primosomal protein N' (replication factor Y)